MPAIFTHRVQPEFDAETGAYRVVHDVASAEPISTTIVLAASSLTAVEPSAMLPLHSSVEPDVLDKHVRGRTREATVSFSFHGFAVAVHDDGLIELIPEEERGVDR